MRIIAGPCQHESLAQSAQIAQECKRVCESYGYEYYFKASYDKANRSSVNGERGVGLEATMFDFRAMKETMDIKTVTDVHSVFDLDTIIYMYEDAVDVLQIPALLCRQTDLIQAACATDKIVNIKKGQFMAPWDMNGVLSKTEDAKEVWITERGTSFGYNNLVVDFTGMLYMVDNLGVPILFDGTHSTQKPSLLGEGSDGNREYVPGLTRAASAMGINNFFLEVHADPETAPSDGPSMLHIEDFEEIIDGIYSHSYTG
jgi:2-dehydro-3-deoxyphosphooctonate aldolase (KDO 8-P synthase)